MYEIELFKPSDINSKRVFNQINKLILSGVKSNEIGLCMHFLTDNTQSILDQFRNIKNRFAFNRDNTGL